ncbi:putative leucine-rich repeat receptor-like protein kinase [Abeliophyllum distichum]|uniref:Leucine-rich repeat receptor-like protein kinase n=1 Tax=Abeliophyllum distichum TaxID=126358 RepID=A0ABD1P1H2_9LAMI
MFAPYLAFKTTMFFLFLDYVLFFMNLHLVSSASLPQAAAIHLLQFQNSLPESTRFLLPWNQSISHCQWPGVSCYSEEDFRVESLNLTRYGLSGIFEKSVSNLCKLPDLLILDLSGNNFTGKIPALLGNCSKLNTILLNENSFSGSIPVQLFKSRQILQIDLGYNLLTGIIPLSTNNLTKGLRDFPSSCSLSDLRIHENLFSGPLPVSLSNCRNLSVLYASSNNLGGIIPPNTFKGLQELEFLYLDRNKFEGEIPESLWGLRNLKELILADNMFNQSISEDISCFKQLTYLDLSGNNLTGHIPRSISSLGNLNHLFLYDNMITSFIPPGIGNCSSLVEIRLQHNFISGNLPSEISHNDLTGVIPSDLGKNNLPGLVKLDLTGNRLNGTIPSGMCAGNRLVVLALGNNNFNGHFPKEIMKCKSLNRLILRNNLLQGSIPDGIEKNSGISYFDIRGNLLEGRIPIRFGFWSNLSMIDLSENKLSGSIPKEFGNLHNLQVLRISSNRLTGEIPRELIHCRKLTELDLSTNNLSGQLPPGILSSFIMKSIRLQENKFKGVIPDSFTSGQSLQEMQLGSNMLEGPIPCSLSKIQHFSSVLNLSMNKLSGEIPKCLSNLDKLEILDISSNGFSGEIPSEVNNMVSLSFVNISFNLLSGKIPDSWGKILDSHPGSSLGNPRLCLLSTESTNCGKEDRKSYTRGKILAGIMAAVVLLLAFLLAAVYILLIRIQNSSSTEQSILHSQSRTEDLPEDLNFEDILRATERWSDKYVIGRGKHGTVYRTQSVRSRKTWAVKKVDLSESKISVEMRTLSLIRHRNVVRMEGYSIRNGYGYIVTDYMPGGTLHELVHQENPRMTLNWETRFRIALGIAQGLSYLHHDCVPKIIHRDIKSDNILIDSELEPKIGDFGTAKLDSDIDESSTVSEIVGTLGYIAPELYNAENAYSTRLTEKCDVYSYGVILLELLCRKLPVDPSFEEGLDIASWVRKNLQSNHSDFLSCFDEEIQCWDLEEQRKVLDLMDIAIKCTEFMADNRPSMREAVGSLISLNCERKSSVNNTGNSGL